MHSLFGQKFHNQQDKQIVEKCSLTWSILFAQWINIDMRWKTIVVSWRWAVSSYDDEDDDDDSVGVLLTLLQMCDSVDKKSVLFVD